MSHAAYTRYKIHALSAVTSYLERHDPPADLSAQHLAQIQATAADRLQTVIAEVPFEHLPDDLKEDRDPVRYAALLRQRHANHGLWRDGTNQSYNIALDDLAELDRLAAALPYLNRRHDDHFNYGPSLRLPDATRAALRCVLSARFRTVLSRHAYEDLPARLRKHKDKVRALVEAVVR